MSQNKIHLSEFIVNAFFTACLTVFAVWVIVLHISQFIGFSFLNVCTVYSIIIAPVLFLLIKKYCYVKKHSCINLRENELNTIIIVVLLALIGAAISLGAIRPDTDDVDYIARAVYFLKYYHETVNIKLQPEYGLVQNLFLGEGNIFRTIEFFCAYLALIVRLPFLHIYHLFLPALAGAMIPLAWFLAFSKFTKRTIIAGLATTAVCVFLSIDGATHQSFGNYAFVRIWQGKTILMSIGVPLFIAFSLDFFHLPIFSNWCKLFLLLVACSGLSPMASFFMPFMGVLLGLSYWCTQGTKSQDILKKILLFFASYFYLLLVTFYCFINLDRDRLDYVGFQLFRFGTFEKQFNFVFVGFLSYPSIIFVLFTILTVIALDRSWRRFIIVWITTCIALFLNPIVSPYVTKITTFNGYWRLFYLLPFPLLIGLPMSFMERLKKIKPEIIYAVFLGLMLVALVGNLQPHKYATFRKVPFAFGHYKTPPLLELQVKKILSVSKPGPMLAPYKYASLIPMYSPDFPQVWIKKYALYGFSIKYGTKKDFDIKKKAFNYITGSSKKGIEEIQYLIRKGLVNIVLPTKITRRKGWNHFYSILTKNGFTCAERNKSFLVFVRNTNI